MLYKCIARRVETPQTLVSLAPAPLSGAPRNYKPRNGILSNLYIGILSVPHTVIPDLIRDPSRFVRQKLSDSLLFSFVELKVQFKKQNTKNSKQNFKCPI